MNQEGKVGSVLVVGGGIAGMQAVSDQGGVLKCSQDQIGPKQEVTVGPCELRFQEGHPPLRDGEGQRDVDP